LRIKVVIAILFIKVLPLSGQNLVFNGSAEIIDTCWFPFKSLRIASGWFEPNNSSPELFNNCSIIPFFQVPSNRSGFQYAKQGNGYFGIGLASSLDNSITANEYISTTLKRPLKEKYTYCVSFYVALAQWPTNCAFDRMGALITKEIPTYPFEDRILESPQIESPAGVTLTDTLNWTLVQDSFVAQGGEQYLTIGQFNAFSDLTLETFGGNPTFYETYYYIDSIVVLECAPPDGLFLEIPNVFTPNGDGQNDGFTATLENVATVQIHIYNRWGGEVFTSQDPNFRWNGTHNGEDLAEGVYFVVIQAVGLNGETAIEKQAVHLFR
jgi:gliding motility-associated-like protein